jgi:uncharacterized protein (TIGR03437 family)
LLWLDRVAPTLFSANGAAAGPAAALILRVRADGTQAYEYAAAAPIDFGPAGDRLFLVLFATGLRNAASATVAIGSVAAPVLYLGPQPDTPGLDQVNAELPRTLAGAGTVAVRLSADGKPANPVTLTFR